MSKRNPFVRVFAPCLCPSKNWYILNSALCGVEPRQYFADRRHFTEAFDIDFSKIRLSDAKDQNGAQITFDSLEIEKNRKGEVYVATTFGLIGAVLRQKCPGKLLGDYMENVRNLLNSLSLEHVESNGVVKSPPKSKSEIDELELETQDLKKNWCWLTSRCQHSMCLMECLREQNI